jgi:hypothetical protein
MRNRWVTVALSWAVVCATMLLGSGVAQAGPAPGVLDGDSCTDPGSVRVERSGQHWEPLDASVRGPGGTTLTLTQTTTVTNTYKLTAGVSIKVVNLSAGFDVAHAEAIALQGSFAAPADPPGAQWVLGADVRVQDHLVYACQGGKYARVGHVGQTLNQLQYTHHKIPATPYIPG